MIPYKAKVAQICRKCNPRVCHCYFFEERGRPGQSFADRGFFNVRRIHGQSMAIDCGYHGGKRVARSSGFEVRGFSPASLSFRPLFLCDRASAQRAGPAAGCRFPIDGRRLEPHAAPASLLFDGLGVPSRPLARHHARPGRFQNSPMGPDQGFNAAGARTKPTTEKTLSWLPLQSEIPCGVALIRKAGSSSR